MAIYAVSDIHGYYDLFLKGLMEIGFSNQDYLWCLGDMIDRGPDGKPFDAFYYSFIVIFYIDGIDIWFCTEYIKIIVALLCICIVSHFFGVFIYINLGWNPSVFNRIDLQNRTK